MSSASNAATCNCGCSTVPKITNAEHACACGCECCAPHELSREEEIVELQRLRDAAERRPRELEAS